MNYRFLLILLNGILVPIQIPFYHMYSFIILASVVKSAPPINFLLYIPEQKNSPLNIIKRDGSLSSTNAFLIPRWGGIRIFNKGQGNLKLAREGLKESMEVFVSQLRDLLGIFDGFADLKSILVTSS